MEINEEIEATYNAVKKLTGFIKPVGESHIDNDRFINLQILTGVVDRLLTDIDAVAIDNKNKVGYSMARAGKFASEFLDKIGIEP